MAVRIGSARIDENGRASGGQAGDQTGMEVSTQDWYLHSKGWYVIRPKDSAAAEKIACNMQWACDSKYIGYDQSQNNTLYNAVKPLGYNISKLRTYCETDCARLVRVCVLYAGINVCDFYTGNMKDALIGTGKFTLYTSDDYCKSSAKLKRGDILVTRTKGHTVVVLSNGSGASSSTSTSSRVLKKGLSGSEVKTLQENLIKLGYSCGSAGADGDFGTGTETAVKTFQKANGLTVDGQVGAKTQAKIDELLKASNTSYKALSVGTGKNGLTVTARSLNVRTEPQNGTIVSSYKQGTKVVPTQRTSGGFDFYWFKTDKGWISGKYLNGWVLDKAKNKWWYVDNGSFYKSVWKQIGGSWFYFESDGYMAANKYIKYKDHYCYVDANGYWIPEKDTKNP